MGGKKKSFKAISHHLVISLYLFSKCLPRGLGQLIIFCYWCKVYCKHLEMRSRDWPNQANQINVFSQESMSMKSPKRLANPFYPKCKIMDVAFHNQPKPLLICQTGSFCLLFVDSFQGGSPIQHNILIYMDTFGLYQSKSNRVQLIRI